MTDVDTLAARIHEISTGKGFKEPDLSNLPEKLMLSVSELSEALEEHRSGKPLVYFVCDSCGGLSPGDTDGHMNESGDYWCSHQGRKPEGILVEIGDSIIRNLHMMHSLLEEAKAISGEPSDEQWTVSKILTIKVDYNAGRPAMHGRNY